MADSGPSKRARSDEERDAELYLADGNVILSAKDTDSGNVMLFRVHKSVLSKHCAVMRSMFELPSPAFVDIYDGVPRVEMQDEASHLKAFLGIMYDPCLIPMGHFYEHLPFVLKALSLADKYEADALKHRLVAQLDRDWPASLDDFDLLRKDHSVVFGKYAPSALRLARRCNIQSIRHCAFYCLLASPCNITDVGVLPSREELDREDLLSLLVGRERMQSFFRDFDWHNDVPLNLYSWDCFQTRCPSNVSQAWRNIHSTICMAMDPLSVLRETAKSLQRVGSESWEDPEDMEKLCDECRLQLAIRTQAFRRHLWEQIPRIFMLPAAQ